MDRSTNSDVRWKSCKAWTPHVYHYNSCVHNTVHNPPYENKEHVPRETCNEWMCWMVKIAACQRMINSWSPLLNLMSRLNACMFTRNLEIWSLDRSRFVVVEIPKLRYIKSTLRIQLRNSDVNYWQFLVSPFPHNSAFVLPSHQHLSCKQIFLLSL